MNLYRCGGGSSIEYIYKDGKWNSKYPKYSNSSMGGEGTFTYNSDGSFTWKGNARAGMGFKNMTAGRSLIMNFVAISNCNNLWIETVDDTYKMSLNDNYTSGGSIHRIFGFVLQDPDNTYYYIGGNNYSYKIYEIILI